MTELPVTGMCHCGKAGYTTRAEARKFLRYTIKRDGSGGRMNVYRCPDNASIWHFGHELYRKIARRRSLREAS